jgi:hypothetical protein
MQTVTTHVNAQRIDLKVNGKTVQLEIDSCTSRRPASSAWIAPVSHGSRSTKFANAANLPPIYDCYALNVTTDDDVWLHYFDAFPLVHLHDARPTSIYRGLPVRRGHALAVYGGGFSWQALLARRSGLFDRLDSCQPVAPFGTAGLPLPPQPDWKGLSLYLTDRDALWAIDLAVLET